MDPVLNGRAHGFGLLAGVVGEQLVVDAGADVLGDLRIVEVHAHERRDNVLLNLVLDALELLVRGTGVAEIVVGVVVLVVVLFSILLCVVGSLLDKGAPLERTSLLPSAVGRLTLGLLELPGLNRRMLLAQG